MKQPYRCWSCERDQWSAAKKNQPRCSHCGMELDGPLAKDHCNACGRELLDEEEHNAGLCGVCQRDPWNTERSSAS